MTTNATNHETPKCYMRQLAANVGCPVGDLLVMARQNDPFNCGSPTDRAQGEWFASLWQTMNFRRGVHLRAIHYAVSHGKGKHRTHDGKPYENTEECWEYLGNASKKARYLGLVDANAFTDARNPAPVIYAPELTEPESPDYSIDEFTGFHIPSIDVDLEARVELPGITVDGYSYDPGEQPYHLEVWCEKSTMDYVLDPVCERHKANLCTAMGFTSITSVIQLLSRIEAWIRDERPVRIFYISDFDPAGDCMPRVVARQLQFWLRFYGFEGDVKLRPFLLTAEQVEHYDLPRKPIKESDKRKETFEERRGSGAVELDALEGIYPGELQRLLSDALRRYRDYGCESRIDDAYFEARQAACEAWESQIEPIAARVGGLRDQAQGIIDRFRPKLERLASELKTELGPIRQAIQDAEQEIREEIEHAADSLDVDLPTRPLAYVEPPDESEWLFDSTRGYLEQLRHFMEHMGQ